jgi:peptidoglycan hydrolase-like protein with peptidoglycan-binding domain
MAKTKNTKKSSKNSKGLSRLHFLSFKSLMAIADALIFAAGGLWYTGTSNAASGLDQNPYKYACSDGTIIREGSRGNCVKRAQWYLRQRDTHTANFNSVGQSCDNRVAVDGVYGPITRDAVYRFQAYRASDGDRHLDRNRVPLSADGVVGPKTWGSWSYGYRWKNTPEPC